MKKLFCGPVERLKSLHSEKLTGSSLDLEVLQEAGCFVVQNVLGEQRLKDLLLRYNRLSQPQPNEAIEHPTEIRLESLEQLGNFTEEVGIQGIAETLFDGEAGWDFLRIVRKDSQHRKPVFLHQDFCYQMGIGDRYSLFIALTPNHSENGGIGVYLGTHKLGYLGDAGELNADVLPEGLPILRAHLSPGDVLVMHSAAWHESGINHEGSDRVYLELHLVPSESPYSQGNICGSKKGDWSFNGALINRDMDHLFVSSRSQKLKAFYDKHHGNDLPSNS